MNKKILTTLILTPLMTPAHASLSDFLNDVNKVVKSPAFGEIEKIAVSSIKISADLFATPEERKATSALLKIADTGVQKAFQMAKDPKAQKKILTDLQRVAVGKLLQAIPEVAPHYKWMTSYEENGRKYFDTAKVLLQQLWNVWQNDSNKIPQLTNVFQSLAFQAFLNFNFQDQLKKHPNLVFSEKEILQFWNLLRKIDRKPSVMNQIKNDFLKQLEEDIVQHTK